LLTWRVLMKKKTPFVYTRLSLESLCKQIPKHLSERTLLLTQWSENYCLYMFWRILGASYAHPITCNRIWLYISVNPSVTVRRFTSWRVSYKKGVQYVKRVLLLFRAVLKFCSTNRLIKFILLLWPRMASFHSTLQKQKFSSRG